jgi:hypothetical protein
MMSMGISSKITRYKMKEDILDHLEKVYEGCQRYMYLIDEEGHCAESDDYVVALHFVGEHIESLKEKA